MMQGPVGAAIAAPIVVAPTVPAIVSAPIGREIMASVRFFENTIILKNYNKCKIVIILGESKKLY